MSVTRTAPWRRKLPAEAPHAHAAADGGTWRLGRSQIWVFALFFGLAFPWTSIDGGGILIAMGIAALAAFALEWALSKRMLLLSALGIQFLLVYAPGMGDAVKLGVTRIGLTASPGSILEAIGALVAFLFLLGLVAWQTRTLLQPATKRAPAEPSAALLAAKKTIFGVGVLFVLTMLAASATGRLSNYSDAASVARDSGGIRLELLYESALFLSVTYPLLARVNAPYAQSQSRRQRIMRLGVSVLLVLFLFVLQSRRVMLICAAISGLVWLAESRQSQAASRALRRRLALLFVMLAFMVVGSNAWRSGDEADSGSITGRFERVFKGFGEIDVSQKLDDRLTYLWFDAVARDLEGVQEAAPDVGDLFLSSFARIVPHVIWEGKDNIPDINCEVAFQPLGIDSDLPCTPQTEGWLAGGFWGFLIAALGWGFTLGVAETLVARGPGLAAVFGLLLFVPMPILENGIFTWLQSLRLALIGTTIVALAAFAAGALLRARRADLHPDESGKLPTHSRG